MADTNTGAAAAKTVPDFSDIAVNVRLLNEPQGKHIAMASVQYHGFNMDNFKVFNGENGLFLGEPTVRDGKSNSFVKTIRVSGDELKEVLNQKALEGYNAAVDKLIARAADAKNMEVRPSMQKQMADASIEANRHNADRPAPASGKNKQAEI